METLHNQELVATILEDNVASGIKNYSRFFALDIQHIQPF